MKKFLPLIIIFLAIGFFTFATTFYFAEDSFFAMRMFMAGFFLVFGFFKILKLPSFVKAYREYDLISKRITLYAYLYPIIELSLGLFYLFAYELVIVSIISFVVMTISTIGVLDKLLKREQVMCACLGTVFKIPMTWVTLLEDLLMAVMAILILQALI